VSAVTVSPEGRLTASSETIEALKRLCAEDAAELVDSAPELSTASVISSNEPIAPKPVVVRVAPPVRDREIEALLGSLMVESYQAAMQAFRLSGINAQPGGNVYTYEACSSQAARLTRAFAGLVEALARHRGKGHQKIVVQHLYSGGQAIGMVNKPSFTRSPRRCG
jgi:hypothetical protein